MAKSITAITIILLCVFAARAEDDVAIRTALVNFSKTLDPDGAVLSNWNPDTDPCKVVWTGIFCRYGDHVSHVVLEGHQLNGTLDADSLCQVSTLRVLSLQNNNVQGSIPGGLDRCTDIRRIYVGNNRLSGGVPAELTTLRRLETLDISDNDLSGPLPAFAGLKELKVSGNPALCGGSGDLGLPRCEAPAPANPRRRNVGHYVAMWAGYVALFFALLFVFVFVALHPKKYFNRIGAEVSRVRNTWSKSVTATPTKQKSRSSPDVTTSSSSEYAVSMADSKSTSLVFLDQSRPGLKFEELLRSSAELLGRGGLGSIYRVGLYDRGVENSMVVKRIKDVRVQRYEFEKRMKDIGKLKHPNVLPLVAYYCSKEEKLLVYDYMRNGSISALLHGRFEDRKLDWQTRLAVASGVAHGLAYLHGQCPNIPHANIKSSNVLLDDKFQPRITEYGLVFLLDNPTLAEGVPPGQWGGYKAPEYIHVKKFTQKSDVYSFGVLLLELLTGKAVETSGLDLPRWVHSVVREEWTTEVFDKNLVRDGTHASEDRMVALLQIAVNCVSNLAAERPAMLHVAKLIDKLKDEEDRSVEQSCVSYSTSASFASGTASETPQRTDVSTSMPHSR